MQNVRVARRPHGHGAVNPSKVLKGVPRGTPFFALAGQPLALDAFHGNFVEYVEDAFACVGIVELLPSDKVKQVHAQKQEPDKNRKRYGPKVD